MSAIAGIIYTDGRVAQTEELAPAIAEMEEWGPDGMSVWAEGSAALAHLALHATPEAEHERWPLCGAHGDVLIADARLDNRDELIRALRPTPRSSHPVTDAALILAAHERWGDEAPYHLIGDFAYALWNPRKQLLQLVRSPFGLKSLYYRIEPDCIFFASTLRAVLALEPRGTLNLPWVASVLTRRTTAFEESAIVEIRKVPIAHLVHIDVASGHESRQRFWQPTLSDEFTRWSEEEWAESFCETFEQAVKASLRSPGPIAMSVSGGLDSSTLALLTHRLMHEEERLPQRPVYTYSLRMAGWPDTDESFYRNAVIERLPHFHNQWVDVEQAWDWSIVRAWHRQMSSHSAFPNAFMFHPFYEQAQQMGCRVKVSGSGGDIITGAEDYSLVAALRSFRWHMRPKEAGYFARAGGKGYLKLARLLLYEYAPEPVQRWWKQRREQDTLFTEHCVTLVPGDRSLPPPPQGLTPMQQYTWKIYLSPFYLQPFEQRAEILALHGMELRAPYYNRRLVELSFNMPQHFRIAGGNNRVLMKRTLARDLPRVLRERTTKADFTSFTADSIKPEDRARALALPPHALLRQYGLVDVHTWQRWATQPSHPVQTTTLYRAAHLEQWLSQLKASLA
ncbi:MAG: asparagine synthase-related protein [Chloroflexota bacterium]|nr:asparagine synthase-related protein [Chloroflexota bacterium]